MLGTWLYCSQWSSQPKNLGGENFLGRKMFDFWRITLFCLEIGFSQHKLTIFSKNWGDMDPFSPPGYACDCSSILWRVAAARIFSMLLNSFERWNATFHTRWSLSFEAGMRRGRWKGRLPCVWKAGVHPKSEIKKLNSLTRCFFVL